MFDSSLLQAPPNSILCSFVKFAKNDRRTNCCSARTFNNITCAKCKTLPTHLCRWILCAWRIFENHYARALYKNGKSWGFLSSSRDGWNFFGCINVKIHLHHVSVFKYCYILSVNLFLVLIWSIKLINLKINSNLIEFTFTLKLIGQLISLYLSSSLIYCPRIRVVSKHWFILVNSSTISKEKLHLPLFTEQPMRAPTVLQKSVKIVWVKPTFLLSPA